MTADSTEAVDGYVVVLREERSGDLTLDWDGELHQARADAEKELTVARKQGNDAHLAIVVRCFEQREGEPS